MDERLLIEAAQQDPSHFAELYEHNFDRVYAYIAYRVHDREEAQDLTAEVFHQALANLDRFEWRGAPFVAWLMRIAANTLADRWHRTSREPSLTDDDPHEQAAADACIEQRVMLSKLVDTLPDDQRLVILRRFVEQRSLRDIALELGRSEGAIKQLQFRALQALRTRIRSTHV